MWIKFLCWFLGCKTVVKAYTGHKMQVHDAFVGSYDAPMYRWEQQKFCIRCGKPNQHHKGK